MGHEEGRDEQKRLGVTAQRGLAIRSADELCLADPKSSCSPTLKGAPARCLEPLGDSATACPGLSRHSFSSRETGRKEVTAASVMGHLGLREGEAWEVRAERFRMRLGKRQRWSREPLRWVWPGTLV